jgi:hypothetical protein
LQANGSGGGRVGCGFRVSWLHAVRTVHNRRCHCQIGFSFRCIASDLSSYTDVWIRLPISTRSLCASRALCF